MLSVGKTCRPSEICVFLVWRIYDHVIKCVIHVYEHTGYIKYTLEGMYNEKNEIQKNSKAHNCFDHSYDPCSFELTCCICFILNG